MSGEAVARVLVHILVHINVHQTVNGAESDAPHLIANRR
jgi:hypothetical protein